MSATLLWYDLETFGRNPAWDRIAQYASVRTGADFEPVGDPTVLYCRASPEYLPEPEACLVTGLTPQRVKPQGLSEAEFADRVHREMTVPGSCVVGYNTVRFDDEFIRNLFYRNFYDPYRREYADGNSRWDIVDLVRMTHDLRPEGITWPEGEDGKPVFQLELLSAANGLLHNKAHDALSDVYATIALARLVHERQPKLFEFLFKLRKKDEVR
ncbi:MAG: exodeoxyribonuclease I, partial [Spirochaeta sp.]|nr:exodeoxyribonuclease I [Spirochaeta sp.]